MPRTAGCARGPGPPAPTQPYTMLKQLERDRKHRIASQIQELAADRAKQKSRMFRLFDLPPELRNLIYAQIASNHTAFLEKGQLTDCSGVLDVNDQLRNEYHQVVLLHTRTILIEIEDFDFRQAADFLNGLSDGGIDALHARSKRIDEGIKIRLNISREPNSNADEPLLYQWLDRAGNESMRGTSLKLSYYLASLPYPLELISTGNRPKKIKVLESWRHVLHGYESSERPNERSKRERGRSRKAF